MSATDSNLAVSQANLMADSAMADVTNYHLSAVEFGQGVYHNDHVWEEREPRLREEWESQNSDSAWEDVKQWVREGWENAKKTVSGE